MPPRPRPNVRLIRQTALTGEEAPRPRAGTGPSLTVLPNLVPAVIYSRVSSKDQEKEGFSIPAQQRLLRDYAASKGFRVDAEFIDIETAKRAGRQQFGQMIAWLKKHKTCRAILVEKTDRLYRNMKDYVLLDELELEIHLVKEGSVISEESRSSDKFMHGIKVVMAKNYVDNLSEEARKGMAEKAEQGIWPTKSPIGYRNVTLPGGKRVIEIDPTLGPIIARMFELYAAGDMGLRELSRWVRAQGALSPRGKYAFPISKVHQILTTLIYTGDFVYKGRVHKGIHEPLITRELWDRVQERLEDRSCHAPKDQKHDFTFTGLVLCGACLERGEERRYLVGEIKKEKYIYYRCEGCRLRKEVEYVPERLLHAGITRALATLQLDEDTLTLVRDALRASHADMERQHTEALDKLRKQYENLQRRLDTAYDDRLDGRISVEMYERKANEWRTDQARVLREIEVHTNANRSYMEDGIALVELAGRAGVLYASAEVPARRQLLNFVTSNSVWRGDNLEVRWRRPFDLLAQSLTEARKNDAPGANSEGKRSLWSGKQDSNLRPSAPKADALPG